MYTLLILNHTNRIITSKKGYKELEKLVEEHISKYRKNEIEVDSVASTYNYDFNILNRTDVKLEIVGKNQILFGWNYIKWYDGYEEVDAINDSLNKLQKNGYGYTYARIGEDITDIEEFGYDATEKDEVKHFDFPSFDRNFDDYYYEVKSIANKTNIDRDER